MKVTVEMSGETYVFQQKDPTAQQPTQVSKLMALFPEVMFGYSGGYHQTLRLAWKTPEGELRYGEVTNIQETADIIKGISLLIHPLAPRT